LEIKDFAKIKIVLENDIPKLRHNVADTPYRAGKVPAIYIGLVAKQVKHDAKELKLQ